MEALWPMILGGEAGLHLARLDDLLDEDLQLDLLGEFGLAELLELVLIS